MREAVDRALEHHLKTRTSRERIRESEARLDLAWSSLNPTLGLAMSAGNRSSNLAAMGLSGNNLPIPAYVTPFYTFDSRLQLLYNFIDSASRWRVKGAEVEQQVAAQELHLAQQQVSVLTSMAYVQLANTLEAERAVRADLEVAERVLALARHQKEVGVAAGIDVTRSENARAELQLRQAGLLEARQRAQLELARLTGLSLASQLTPDPTPLATLEAGLNLDKALEIAQEKRVELSLARLQEELLTTQVSMAQASDAPKMGLSADYGFLGNTPTSNAFDTYSVGLVLQVPLYDGGHSDAQDKLAQSRLEQARIEREDRALQVEQEVRAAFLKLDLARSQIVTSQSSFQLAEKELAMASNRFKNGLSDSLEVIEAQAALVRARTAIVAAQISLQLAQIQLAASLGQPEMVLMGGNP